MSRSPVTPSLTAGDLLAVFNAQPGATLLLSPDLVIRGASDDYLVATLTKRDAIVGRHLFDAFPDNPLTPQANAVANVRASLTQVMATRQPHDMAPQHYDVPDPTQPGHFMERHWLPRHTPVLDAAGQVQFILQSVQDITASRVAARRLRESQASEQAARAEAAHHRHELRYFLEMAPVAVAVYQGPQHRVELANATTLAIWGRTLPDVLHRPLFDALPEAATPAVVALFERAFTTGITQTSYEQPTTIHRHGRSEQVYWNTVFEPQRGPDGRITGLFTIGTDVTEQVRARQQVEQLNHELETRVRERTHEAEAARAEAEEQRNRLERLFRQAPAQINLFTGLEHVWTLVHPRTQDLLADRPLQGLARRQALPELPEEAHEPLDQVYRTGQPVHVHESLRRLDRYTKEALPDEYYDITFQPTFDTAGRVEGVMSFAVNVTERVRARQNIEESEARFRLLADAAPNQVWAVNPDATIRYANQAFVDFIGLSLEQYQQTGWSAYLHPEELDFAHQTLETAIRTRAPYVLEHRMRRHDGEYRWLLSQGAPSFYPNGELYGYVGSAIDITELKQTNEQLVRTNVDLDNFIYTASHDLKAPISNIEGLLHLLEAELPAEVIQTEAVGSTLVRMLDAVERFKRTIDHLTDVSKLQKEHAPLTTLVNLAAIVEDVRQDLLPQLQAIGARLVIAVSELPPVQFSEKNLRSILYNLLSNAIKYHSPDRTPHIDVRAHVRPGYTVLEVHDNGLGLAPGQLSRLFGLFQRFHDHVEGTGIGLYMVKRMVENAGGRIEVHSQLGAGTTFLVFLPHPTRLSEQLLPAQPSA